MASNPGSVEDVLASTTTANEGLSEAIAQLAEQLRQLQAGSPTAAQRASVDRSTSGSSMGGTLLEVLGGGLGLSPLIWGIVGLFDGGGGSPAPALLTRFALAPSIQANAGVSESGGQVFAVDYPQGGLPRAVSTPMPAPAQITVQVQAMDSRSFLDHSGDIALAVRQAMLESSVLNDVVREA